MYYLINLTARAQEYVPPGMTTEEDLNRFALRTYPKRGDIFQLVKIEVEYIQDGFHRVGVGLNQGEPRIVRQEVSRTAVREGKWNGKAIRWQTA